MHRQLRLNDLRGIKEKNLRKYHVAMSGLLDQELSIYLSILFDTLYNGFSSVSDTLKLNLNLDVPTIWPSRLISTSVDSVASTTDGILKEAFVALVNNQIKISASIL